jgi:hypothetical protein
MRSMALISLFALTTLMSVQKMSAQRMFSSSPHFAAPHPAAHSSGFAGPAAFRGRGAYPVNFLYPFGLFSDSFYPDYSNTDVYATGYPVAAEPPVILLQYPPTPATMPERAPAPVEPLMIEWRGNHYVRVSGEANSNAQMIDQVSSDKTSRATAASPAAQDLQPVDLVFRDGHREQVSEYTIADGVLYATGAYYAGGSGNKKIELSSLNLPETISSNRSHGMTFRLPAAPNEVIVRP